MEGKAVLFKSFGDVDAWPVPLACCRKDGKDVGKTDPERVIAAVKALAPQYGGINLEDIASPACFEIEDRLDAELEIPVFQLFQNKGVLPLGTSKRCIEVLHAGVAKLKVEEEMTAEETARTLESPAAGTDALEAPCSGDHTQR